MLLFVLFPSCSQKANDTVAFQQQSKLEWGSLRAAACSDLGQSRADSVNRNTQRLTCHSAKHSICLETQYGHFGCVLKETPRVSVLPSQLSLVALLLLSFRVRLLPAGSIWRKKKCFHGEFKELIQRGNQTSSVTQLFDTLIGLLLDLWLSTTYYI